MCTSARFWNCIFVKDSDLNELSIKPKYQSVNILLILFLKNDALISLIKLLKRGFEFALFQIITLISLSLCQHFFNDD